MTTNHYPWNLQVLVDWLNLEVSKGIAPKTLANNLQIPLPTIQAWQTQSIPTIELAHVVAIAQYRGKSVIQTAQWLGIKPAHFEALLHQTRFSNSIDQPV